MTRLHLHVAPPLSVPQAAASIRNRKTCSTYRWWSQSGCWRWAWATTPPSRCTSEPKSCSKPGPEEPNMGSKVTDGWILRLKLCYSHRDRTEEQSVQREKYPTCWSCHISCKSSHDDFTLTERNLYQHLGIFYFKSGNIMIFFLTGNISKCNSAWNWLE